MDSFVGIFTFSSLIEIKMESRKFVVRFDSTGDHRRKFIFTGDGFLSYDWTFKHTNRDNYYIYLD